jgi:hypothetical protein
MNRLWMSIWITAPEAFNTRIMARREPDREQDLASAIVRNSVGFCMTDRAVSNPIAD